MCSTAPLKVEPPKFSGKRGREERVEGSGSAKQGPRLSEDISPDDVPRILGQNAAARQAELGSADSRTAFELSIRHQSVTDKARAYSFSKMPEVVTSWKMHSILNADIGNSLFTQIRANGDNGSDLSEGEAAQWVPMVYVPENKMLMGSPPTKVIRISARNGSRGYDIHRLIGSGGYGSVYLCNRSDTGEDVAIKFQRIDQRYLLRIPKVGWAGTARVISPAKVAGLFAHYVMQRAYGGCLPAVVCAKDVFLYATPNPPPAVEGQPLQWYICVAMENMDGDMLPLAIEQSKTREGLLGRMMSMFGKMTKAIYDMELQSMFHNDIKPGNFLHSRGGAIIKVTDFDLTCFGSRIGGIGSNASQLLRQLVSHFTEGGVDTSASPWDATDAKELLKCQYMTTKEYAPPEYALMIANIASMPPDRHDSNALRDYETRTLRNSDWLSRMMAYELVCSFRELALGANMNAPYYIKSDNSYVSDIKSPESNRKRGVSIHRMIGMDYDGLYAIAPSDSAVNDEQKMHNYDAMRRKTIVTANLRGEEVRVANEFNNMVASVIAPCKPHMVDNMYKMHCPMDERTLLCAPQDRVDEVRPTVSMLLKSFTRWLRLLGVMRDMPAGSPRINVPASIGDEIEATAKFLS